MQMANVKKDLLNWSLFGWVFEVAKDDWKNLSSV
jgi:hypothetical protein